MLIAKKSKNTEKQIKNCKQMTLDSLPTLKQFLLTFWKPSLHSPF